MQISFFIAKRYVKKQGKTKLIYRLSRLACYSMALGVAILLLVLSTMNGMERLLSALFYAYTPALKIESKMGKTFLSDKPLKDKIIHLSGVTDIIEILEATALIRLQNRQAIATIKGVSPNFTVSDFYKNCARIDPVAFLEDGQPQATLGIGLSQLLRWAPHKDRVEVFYPKQGLYQVSKPYKRLTIEVNGCFSITRKIDSKYLIAPIHFVEGLTDGLHQRTYWEVVIPDTADLARTQLRIQKLLPDGFKVRNCQEQNEVRRRAIFIERLSVYFVFALVLLLASLHIFFMLCMLILHKQKDIATLIALGATPAQVGRIFLYNGLLISLEGMAYGFFIGWSLAFLQQKFGMITFTTVRGKVPYPIEIHHLDGLYTAILTILVTTLASLWPAKRAIELAGKG